MTWLLLGTRVGLAGVFAVAAASKAARPATIVGALRAAGVRRAAPLGAAVAVTEGVLAVALLGASGRALAATLAGSAVVLASFLAWNLRASARQGEAVPCGCFGARTAPGPAHAARTAALASAALAGALAAGTAPAGQAPVWAAGAVAFLGVAWAVRLLAEGRPVPPRLAEEHGHTRRQFLLRAATGLAVVAFGGTWLAREIAHSRRPAVTLAVTDGTAVLSPPEVAKPGYLKAIRPPPFATTVTRIVGDPASAIRFPGAAAGQWGSDARHHYSDDQPWNADQTLIAIQNYGDGTPSNVYLDGETYRPRLPQCPTYEVRDDRWHPVLPTVRVNAGGNLLEWFDVAACRQVRSWTLLEGVEDLGLTDGNLTMDGRFVVLGNQRSMFALDMDPQPPHDPYPSNRVGPPVDITYGGFEIDFVSISPSGRYAVVHYRGDHDRVFDIDPDTLAMAPRAMPADTPRCAGTAADGFVYDLGHPDLALDPFDEDEDVIVGQEHCGRIGETVNGTRMGGVVKVRLRDGKVTSLTDPENEAYPYHVSTRNTKRPGLAYVTYYEGEDGRRFDQEIMAVRLDGSGAVERWAHHHSDTKDCYRCEPHAVPSPDGLRLIFASSWSLDCAGRCGAQSVPQAYVVDARAV